MKKELPNIYKSEISNKFDRNLHTYHIPNDSSHSEKGVHHLDQEELSVEDKLKKLFQSSRYVFNIGVEIITKKRVYHTKIAGKVKNSIVTIDGEVIPMIEIDDIIIKDRL
ncbi:MAG: hypothetical protein HFG40_04040 [Bacilli bacterium]|nr:hypothetical protein [Bacilli bacterium]